MKRKLFLAVIAVLVICLTCGMLLVACNKDDDKGKDDITTRPDTAVDIFNDVVLSFGEVKDDTSGTKEFNFGLEITSRDDDKSVFSFAYETLGGKEYFYGATGDGDMMSFKGFDVGGTIETVLSWFGEMIADMVPTDAEEFISMLSDTLASFGIFGDFAKSSNGEAYMLEFVISGELLSLVNGLELPEAVDQVVGVVAPILGLDAGSPASLSGLLNAIAEDYELTFYFGFGANADQGEGEADAAPFGDLALSEKVVEARKSNDDAKNLLNFSVDGTAELKDAEGTVTHKYVIDVDLDLDIFKLIDPILDCVTVEGNMPNGFAMDEDQLDALMAAISEMGYISVEVNEVSLTDGSFVKNVLTLHSNFDEGNAIAQLFSEKLTVFILSADVALGGVYDFDALAGFIYDSLTSALATEEESGGIDVMGLLTDLLGLTNIDTNDIAGSLKDGLDITMSGLVDTLAANGLDLSLAASAVPGIWHNAETMTIKIQQASYGTAVKKTTTELAAVKNDSTASAALVSEVTGVTDIEKEIAGIFPAIGIDNVYTMTGTPIGGGDPVTFEGYILGYSGIDWTQTGEQTVTLYVAAMNDGESLVGLLADFVDLDLTPYPVFGIYTVDVVFNVTVTAADATEITIAGHEDGEAIGFAYSAQSSNSMKTLFELLESDDVVTISYTTADGAKTIALDEATFNKYATILDADGLAVANATNESGDLVLAAGKYTIHIDVNGFVAELPLEVSTIVAKAAEADMEIAYGTLLNYAVVVEETLADGTVKTLTPTSLSYKFGTVSVGSMHLTTKDLSAIGTVGEDRFSVTLNNDLTLCGDHTATVSAKSTSGTSISSMTVTFGTLATPENTFSVSGVPYSVYPGQNVSAITFTAAGKDYKLAWDVENSKWVAKAEDGSVLNDITITLEWKSKGSANYVIGNADSMIANYPNEYKYGSRSTKVYFTAVMNGFTFTDDFTAYEMYANNKTSGVDIGDKLDGFISNATYLGNGSSFKYGANGYGIYASDGTLICSVTVKVYLDDEDKTAELLKDGAFTAAGNYKVEYDLTYNGINQKFYHTVKVNLPVSVVTPAAPAVGMNLNGIVDCSKLGDGWTFKCDEEGNYGIYNASGELQSDYAVTLKVQKQGASILSWSDYTLTAGTITEAGSYRVNVTITFNGVDFALSRVSFTIAAEA